MNMLTNWTKAWFWLTPTLHLVLITFPNGLQRSASSSSLHSHGRLRKWRTLDGIWVQRNCCCCLEDDIVDRSWISWDFFQMNGKMSEKILLQDFPEKDKMFESVCVCLENVCSWRWCIHLGLCRIWKFFLCLF